MAEAAEALDKLSLASAQEKTHKYSCTNNVVFLMIDQLE